MSDVRGELLAQPVEVTYAASPAEGGMGGGLFPCGMPPNLGGRYVLSTQLEPTDVDVNLEVAASEAL